MIKIAAEKVGEKYRCNVCGNEVTVARFWMISRVVGETSQSSGFSQKNG